jgi:hypothetical protein
MDHRYVGAVELDQRERERRGEGMLGRWLGYPSPPDDRSRRPDWYGSYSSGGQNVRPLMRLPINFPSRSEVRKGPMYGPVVRV